MKLFLWFKLVPIPRFSDVERTEEMRYAGNYRLEIREKERERERKNSTRILNKETTISPPPPPPPLKRRTHGYEGKYINK